MFSVSVSVCESFEGRGQTVAQIYELTKSRFHAFLFGHTKAAFSASCDCSWKPGLAATPANMNIVHPWNRYHTITKLSPDHTASPIIGMAPGRIGWSHYPQAEAGCVGQSVSPQFKLLLAIQAATTGIAQARYQMHDRNKKCSSCCETMVQ